METLNKAIGIISYFPDDPEIRTYRRDRFITLINKCNELFNLPIHIIAQNYNKDEIDAFLMIDNVTVDFYRNPLGITQARKYLREWFINSEYDYLIMLDDDSELVGEDASSYLSQIDLYPNCFIEYNKSRLKLFAISKYVMSLHDYMDVSPEKGEGFEDRIFYYTLCKKYPDLHKKFENVTIKEHSISTSDQYSTWSHGCNNQEMVKKSNEIIENC